MRDRRGLGRVGISLASAVVLSLPVAWVALAAPAPQPAAAQPVAGQAAAPAAPAAPGAEPPLPEKIDYNRDVRPILSDNCFACHGFDAAKRKADLRLDTKEGLFTAVDGNTPVAPGQPDKSEVYRRIVTHDEDDVMPPRKSGKSLTPRQVATVKKWVEQGAEWKGHWSYLPVARPAVPAAEDPAFVKNPVDRFVLATLKENGLAPSPQADRVTLIRRLSFDLTGLPPEPQEVAAFVSDNAPDAYEKVVDRLLASPRYGERMAAYWLDMVRYADSIGYHSDTPRPVTPYRDYVINAFNANKRFDVFTAEQIAGDLMPNATVEQKVASAYNRLLQTTEEGGAQAKEYVAKYDADRVRNVSTVWMGATLGCAECHDHKFDPFSAKDFYAMAAFFADVQEPGVGSRGPGMPVPDAGAAAEIARLDATVAGLKKKLEQPAPELGAGQAQWEKTASAAAAWHALDFAEMKSAHAGVTFAKQPDGSVKVSGTVPAKDTYTLTAKTDLKNITAVRLEALNDPSFPAGGPGLSNNGNFVLTEFKVTAAGKPLAFSKAAAAFSQQGWAVAGAVDGKNDTGWAVMPEFGKPHAAVFEPAAPAAGGAGTALTVVLDFQQIYPQHQIGRFRISVTDAPNPGGAQSLPAAVAAALSVSPEKRSDAQKNDLATYYRTIAPELAPVRQQVAAAEQRKQELGKSTRTCLVTVAGQPRTIRVLARGNWQDESGEVVSPAVPHFLPPVSAPGRAPNRLDLAQWLTARDNPLTSRVFVNRLWKLYFGQGLSKILDDVGNQGEWPTHPELLEWLSAEFMEGGWDVKHMVRLIVTSGAYRQSSQVGEQLREKDPYNRLLARQGRFRLDAEFVRDNALAVSGLLVEKVGGESVKPYQPAGYWYALNFPTREWQNDSGESLYRRGLYTWWQRSFLHPSLLAFDAPSREECTVERPRSNIPQQALVLLNDPTYVEAARAFAEKIVKEGGATPGERMNYAFTRAVSRQPKAEEIAVLGGLLAKHTQVYGADKDAAMKLVSTGARPAAKDVDVSELAAWTSVARTILNLHETITRN